MSNQTYPSGPPPVAYVDEVFTDALLSENGMHHAVMETFPEKRVTLKLLFADHSTRVYNVSDAAIRQAIVGALKAGIPVCTDTTPPDMPVREDRGSRFSAPSIHGFEVESAPAIVATETTLYRNAVVMTLSLDDGRQERWVVCSVLVPHLEKYLRWAFPLTPWRASEVNPAPAAPAET